MAKKIFEIKEQGISNKNLKGKYSLTWVEDSLSFDKKSEKQISVPETRDYVGTFIKKRKIILISFFIGLVFSIILGRVLYLQVAKGGYYRTLAEGNRIRLIPIVSERGIIYDRFKKELVENVPNFYLTLIPQDLATNKEIREDVIEQTVAISEISKSAINNLLKKFGSYSYASLVIKENLDYDSALKLYIKSAELPGISIEKGSKRKYLLNNNYKFSTSSLSLSHILGYLGKLTEEDFLKLNREGYLLFDNIGKTGLEKIYEKELRGKYGRKKIEVDAGGHEQKVLAEESPVQGKNLILSLDIEAQAKMESLIKEMLIKSNKKRAAGIAINPNTGAILALVSWPTFNNNDFSGGITNEKYEKYLENNNRPLFNRAISGTYPSGSTVKLIIAAAALQEKIISANTVFLSTGGLQINKWFFRDWLEGGHGATNVRKAIAWSVNTFFYYIGGGYENFTGLGVDTISKYMKSFNLSSKTGIDLPSEASGFIPSKKWKRETKKEDWYVGDTYNLSIGQGDLLVTPLQVAVWTAAVINGGKIIQPHLVEKIEDSTTDKIKKIEYNTKDVPVSNYNLSIIKEGMRDCVNDGSCQLLQYLSFSSGGKTGTAQWNTNNKQDHAWFTSFAPNVDPQIVVTVLIEEGEGGATRAMPVAFEFLKWWGEKYLK